MTSPLRAPGTKAIKKHVTVHYNGECRFMELNEAYIMKGHMLIQVL